MKTLKTCILLLSVLAFTACGSDKKDEKTAQAAEQPANLGEAMTQAQQALEKANVKQAVEPVNFRKLQEVLPEKVAGFERQKMSGETAGALNMKFSKAEGKYQDAGGKKLDIDVMDTGGITMGMMGMAAWASVTIDKEDDNGYERTSTLNGYKSFEKFRKSGSNSELSVMVENRFIVNASCRDCSMETLKSVVNGMDLGRLKGL